MVKASDKCDGESKRTPLLRRHTIEVQATSGHDLEDSRVSVTRALSDDLLPRKTEHSFTADEGHFDSCGTLNNENSSSSVERKPETKENNFNQVLPKVAWSNEPDEEFETENILSTIKSPKTKRHIRPKSCVTPVSSNAVSAYDQKTTNLSPNKIEAEDKLPDKVASRLPSSTDGEKLQEATDTDKEKALPSKTEILDRIAAKVCRSQSTPDIYRKIQKRRVKSASFDEDQVSSIAPFVPYDGLLIQRATFFSPESRRESLVSLRQGDEEDDICDTEKSSKLQGYRSKSGFQFLPFSKLFSKPKSARSRHSSKSSSQGDPELGVENSLQQFNELDKDIIKRTRSALKQRISSASRRRIHSANRKKIQLSIVVNTKPESEDSVPCSDQEDYDTAQRPKSTPTRELNKKKSRTKNLKSRERSVPAELLKSRLGANAERKKLKTRTEKKTQIKVVRRVKKKEIPTMMSEISPVPSDVDGYDSDVLLGNSHEISGALRNSRNRSFIGGYGEGEGVAPARGGLLQTIISEANVYKPISKTWKGNKMHLEVRIRTQKQRSSSDEEQEEVEDEDLYRAEEEKRSWRRGRLTRQDKIEGPSSSGSPAEGKTIGGGGGGGGGGAGGGGVGGRGPGGLLLPLPRRHGSRTSSHAPSAAALRAKEREKQRQILEVCTAKVAESKNILRRLGSNGVWVSLDTLQRGLMSPTEYRVYQDHLKSLESKSPPLQPPNPRPSHPTSANRLRRSSPSPFRR